MNEPTSPPESGPVEDRRELIEGSRSIEWLHKVQPIVMDPGTPGLLDFPTPSSSVDQAALPGDSGQDGVQSPPQPDANS
jgi:hypothetical protein